MTATLFFDTETTGMAAWKLPVIDPSQPKIVQLAAILRDDATGKEQVSINFLIRPNGWKIDPGAARVHGITEEVANRFGIDHDRALDVFIDMMDNAQTIVAHNLNFDSLVLRHALHLYAESQESNATETTSAEIYASLTEKLNKMTPRCSMLSATPIVKILHDKPKHPADFKWPKLSEAIRYFFDEDLDGAHDALVDVRACIRIYDELLKRDAFRTVH